MKIDSQRAAWTAFVEGNANPPTANRSHALGRLKTGARNKTEAAYEQHLELRKQAGEILWYDFERFTFRLADDTRYTPDFAVLLASGIIECHEVKGTTSIKRASGEKVKAPYFIEDAKVKVKVAADRFPFVFKIVYRVNGNWIEDEV